MISSYERTLLSIAQISLVNNPDNDLCCRLVGNKHIIVAEFHNSRNGLAFALPSGYRNDNLRR
jgi:hypothetical protein